MRFYLTGRYREIHVRDVDRSDKKYRISREPIDDRLRRSIGEFGILESPILLERGGRFVIVFGHNRIDAYSSLGGKTFHALAVDEIDPRAYTEYAALKNYRAEIGPVGKLRAVSILRDVPGIDAGSVEVFARRVLGISDEFLHGQLIGLPPVLMAYLDSRDIPFRNIKKLLGLPPEGIRLVAGWLERIPLRVNMFREILDMMIDIQKRDGSLEQCASAAVNPDADRRTQEESLVRGLFAIRYPEYAGLKAKAESLIGSVRSDRFDIEMPPWFDGDSLVLRVNIRKKDDPALVMSGLSRIDPGALRRLLDLL